MKKYVLLIILFFILNLNGCKSKKKVSILPEDRGSAKIVYEKASKYIRRSPEKARLLFKEIMQLFPNSIYAQRSKIGIADSYFKSKDTSSLIIAASEYQEYVNLYPNSPDAVYAKFQTGMCYYKQMKKPGRDQTNTFATIKHFESMINQYPNSSKAEEAKKKIAKSRQYLAIHYFRIGLSNYKFKAYKGAIDRFKQVIDDYPDFKKNDKLFYYTGKSYFAWRKYDSALSFFQKIINSYPKSKYIKKSSTMINKIKSIQSKKGDTK